jgi:hypothetical protein
MTSKVDDQEYDKWHKDTQNLDLLRSFRDQWNASDKKIDAIWTSFRLLPSKIAYLIASHYHYDQIGWSLRTKWKLYTQFDKKLCKNENPGKVTSSINSAVEAQQKIVVLQKTFATLQDNSKTLQDKSHAYEVLKTDHPLLYQDILHKIQVVKGRPATPVAAEVEMTKQPNGCDKAVIKQMLYLLREGHPKPGDHFFKDLLKKKQL